MLAATKKSHKRANERDAVALTSGQARDIEGSAQVGHIEQPITSCWRALWRQGVRDSSTGSTTGKLSSNSRWSLPNSSLPPGGEIGEIYRVPAAVVCSDSRMPWSDQ